MGIFNFLLKRTLGSLPPNSLQFGEVAFSDSNNRLYVGKNDGSIATFARIPAGGSQGDVLAKNSANDYAFSWSNPNPVIDARIPIVAWGVFNGIAGNVQVISGKNFASVSRSSQGVYDVTFTNPVASGYCVIAQGALMNNTTLYSATGFRIITRNGSNNASDSDYISFLVIR